MNSARRTRVLIFHPAPAPYRIDLFNSLSDCFDLTVVFLNREIPYYTRYDQSAVIGALRCRYDFLPSGANIIKRTFGTRLLSFIVKSRPDVVVSSEFSYVTLYLGLFRGKLRSFGIRHVIWSAESTYGLRTRGVFKKFIRKRCGERADALLLYTEAAEKSFADLGIKRDKIFLCSNLQDPGSFKKQLAGSSKAAGQLIRELRLEGKKIILYVGRLSREKNLQTLLMVFSESLLQIPEAVLAIVGDGPLRDRLLLLSHELGIDQKVIFAGHLQGNALFAWYRLGGLLVLPSTREMYGAVVNEALLAGVPVLCSKFAGAMELVKEPKSGRIFDPLNRPELQQCLVEMIGNVRPAEELASHQRPNLMDIPFERDVSSFVRAVKNALGRGMA